MAEPIREEIVSRKGMAIAQRYMGCVNYLYPILTNLSGRHRVFRDLFLAALFEQIKLFNDAAKSDQASRLYLADAGLASLREFLRFAADPARKLISRHQHEVAEIHLAETGAMLGAWIGGSVRKGRGEIKAATATTAPTPARGLPTGTTQRGTRTGTLGCGAPVTTDFSGETATALSPDHQLFCGQLAPPASANTRQGLESGE